MRFALDTPPMRAASPKAGIQAQAFQNSEAGRPIGIADYIIALSRLILCPYYFYLLAP